MPSITRPEAAKPQLVVLASTRAVLTEDDNSLTLSPATITVSPDTGKIVSIVRERLPASSFPADGSVSYVDYSPSVLMPGIVDAHVHLNEPGRTEWEGFYTGTRAAASGGVTTVVDMPLNAIPPTTTLHGFNEKLAASSGQCWVDVGFYGGVVPGNADELLPLVDAGVRGFKGFLIHSGVDEFPAVSAQDIALAMQTLKDADTTLMFHAEMIPPIADSVGDAVQTSDAPLAPHGELEAYNTFLESRPPVFETCAVEEIVWLAPTAPKLHLHIVHLSATECIPILREARARGINITAETCFHYLGLASDDIADGDTRHKCCPPIRSQINQDGLWAELGRDDSVIRTIVSDHSPCTPDLKLLPGHLAAPRTLQVEEPSMRHIDSGIDMTLPEETKEAKQTSLVSAAEEEDAKRKNGDFFAAWGGISSVGLGLPILYTAAQARRHHHCHADCVDVAEKTKVPDIVDIVRLCCQATAAQVGLAHQKGGLKVGLDADVCVFDDAQQWTFTQGDMRWKNRCSPWEGHTFEGRVKATWLRGQHIFALGAGSDGFVSGRPVGKALIEKRGVQV